MQGIIGSPVGVPTIGPPNNTRIVQGTPTYHERNYTLSGFTVDVTGAFLTGVTVKLFQTATDTLVQQTVSDATGAYSFIVDKTQAYYTVEYKAGSPDVYGSSLNTLAGV